MDKWLKPALAYVPTWLDLQMRHSRQPGCIVAIAHDGRIVLERAFGTADLATEEPLTPRHRFRVASHTKSFTTAGIMLLRERKKLRLDDEAGAFVPGLHPDIAQATLSQLLSHTAGIVRDGPDSGQFTAQRSFLSRDELLADLRARPVIDPNTRFKYSNHGFALLGMVIEAVTGMRYSQWIAREVIAAAGLKETIPDVPLTRAAPFARGHTADWPCGRRWTVRGDEPAYAIGSAAGFVSTAGDLVRFFAQLDPGAQRSLLTVPSRHEMIRPQWRNPHASIEGHYGLGIMSGKLNGWDWFGHTGGFLGYVSRTVVLPKQRLAVSVLTNAVDGWAGVWVDGIMHILRGFELRRAPSRRVAGWTGRWWNPWGAVDLVPMGDVVLTANPHLLNPFLDVGEIAVTGGDKGYLALTNGYGSHGEPVRRERDNAGQIAAVWLGGNMLQPEARVAAEMAKRHGPVRAVPPRGRVRENARRGSVRGNGKAGDTQDRPEIT
jgi:CubicO group peptidase (beta-lactamase class C family)